MIYKTTTMQENRLSYYQYIESSKTAESGIQECWCQKVSIRTSWLRYIVDQKFCQILLYTDDEFRFFFSSWPFKWNWMIGSSKEIWQMIISPQNKILKWRPLSVNKISSKKKNFFLVEIYEFYRHRLI